MEQLNHLAELLGVWFTLRDSLEQEMTPCDLAGGPLTFLFDRMATIRSLVLQSGMDPHNIVNMLTTAQNDVELLIELKALLEEIDWLLRDLANEIERRSPELIGLSQGLLKNLLAQLRHLPSELPG